MATHDRDARPPEDGHKRLDPATLVPLLRARPPHADLGAFLRLSRDSLRRVTLHNDGELDSFTRYAIRTAARGPLATIDVELSLVGALGHLTAADLTELHARLHAAWPTDSAGRARVLDRVDALGQLSRLREQAPQAVPDSCMPLVLLAFDTNRPPLWVGRIRDAIAALQPRPGRATFAATTAAIQTGAPALWALCSRELSRVTDLLPEQGST